MHTLDIRRVNVAQYLQPFREGGSMPGLVKGDDDFMYVLKFRGAGQGKKALIAELIGGEVARVAGLKVPELVFMDLDDSFSKTEPDQEIQDLLKFSVGLNLGLHFLSSAMTYDPLVSDTDSMTASKTVLLDSILTNIDRTAKNTNLLIWNKELWLIDHGACLYFHHNWRNWEAQLPRTFPAVKDHVLLSKATELTAAAAEMKVALTEEKLRQIVNTIPEEWLVEESNPLTPSEMREAYVAVLFAKVNNIDALAKEASDAR
ncbi:MAG: HipA family kinase [Saprospiraceae bacterium]